MRPTRYHFGGFTLIEIAIVLFIVALVGIGATSAAIGFIKAKREKITTQNGEAIKVALQNFVARNGRLPCPANPINVPTDATFGIEAPTAGTCTGATAIGTGSPSLGVLGTVPWKSIGLSSENAADGWYNQFDYAVTRFATQTNFAIVGGMRGVLTLHTDTPVANGLPATGNQLNACSTTAGDNSCNLLSSAVVISHGANGFGARDWNGLSLDAPTSALELENTNTNMAFVRAERSEVLATMFDDVILALTPADVLAPLLAQGFIKYEVVVLAEKFGELTASLAAYAVENRTGAPGTWSYPLSGVSGAFAYSLDATKFDGNCDSDPPTSVGNPTAVDMLLIKDPWGNSFRYQRATNTVTAPESCPSYAVFVSAGPDGSFGTTGDNSVYYATRGEMNSIIALSGW